MTSCPICNAECTALDPAGDAEGYDCARHGKFKVSRTVLAVKPSKTGSEWDAAFERAKGRASPGEWPCITTHDF